jgi:hypothetical protein
MLLLINGLQYGKSNIQAPANSEIPATAKADEGAIEMRAGINMTSGSIMPKNTTPLK